MSRSSSKHQNEQFRHSLTAKEIGSFPSPRSSPDWIPFATMGSTMTRMGLVVRSDFLEGVHFQSWAFFGAGSLIPSRSCSGTSGKGCDAQPTILGDDIIAWRLGVMVNADGDGVSL